MTHPAFALLRRVPVPTLRLTVEEYLHPATGARHLHLATEDTNNVFLVAFLTVPMDNTGVAHILEHTTLCGSARFPVRDPFFMMLRRSLNTFMNAFTSSDWTAYPFASQNAKDFDNLLQVYLDAVFFPRLDPLDFAQEGHRLEFDKPDDPATPLKYRGIVYNEMKGAMSSPVRQVLHELYTHLFPTTTYHYNSGGEPAHIPKLTHAQLKAFHDTHYHPSNALFMTYGDRPVHSHQRHFEECALRHFSKIDTQQTPAFQALAVTDEQRYTQPQTVQSYYTVDSQSGLSSKTGVEDKTHLVLGWLLGKSTSQRDVMRASLLSGVLLDNSASPLRHWLESSGLGSGPSPLCGLDGSSREMVFIAGLEGSQPERAQTMETQLLELLAQLAEQGVPVELQESVLHQIELSQREITGDGMPYGLRLLTTVLSPMLHGGDPVDVLHLDEFIEELRRDITDPEFIKRLIREQLLDNPHRVLLVMPPDPQLASLREQAEQAQLQAIAQTLSTADRQRLVAQAQALAERQNRHDDPELLPKVTIADIPAEIKIPSGETLATADAPATWFAQGANGMVYQQIVVDLPALDEELLDLLPLYCDCVAELGINGWDYRQTQARQAAVTGGIQGRYSARAGVDDTDSLRTLFVLSGKALARNQHHLAELLHQTFCTIRFDELDHLRDFLTQIRVETESSVPGRSGSLANTAAVSGFSPAAALTQRWQGFDAVHYIKQLGQKIKEDGELEQIAAGLARLHAQLLRAPRQFLLIGDEERRDAMVQTLVNVWQDTVGAPLVGAVGAPLVGAQKVGAQSPASQNVALVTGATVNFCVKAYPTVAYDHPDSAALTVLAEVLRNGYLHRTIREQGGAYGAGAGYDSDAGAFRMSSHRDPRLQETLADFDRAVEWVLASTPEQRHLEEAILGVISRIDKPASPAGEAKSAFFGALHGRTPAKRRLQRDRVLAVTAADLQRVAATYLQPQYASTVVAGNLETMENAANNLGLTLRNIL